MRLFIPAVAAGVLLFAEASFAQAEPELGTVVKPFKVIGVTGLFDGKEVDLAKPVEHRQVYLFVAADKFDRPTARYIKALDDAVIKGIEGVNAVDVYAVWLTDDVQKSKDYVPKAHQSLRLGQTSIAVFEGARQGPDGWGIDPDAHLTAVVVRDSKIAAAFAYGSTNDTDVPKLVDEIKK